MPVTPRTATQLFEYLQERFGVGSFDEGQSLPYWKYRMTEVTKINSMCR